MVADFFTKPLQGSLFGKVRDIVLGYKHSSTLNDVDESAPQELVRRYVLEGNIKRSDDGPSEVITVRNRSKIQDTLNYAVTVTGTKCSDERVTDKKLSYAEIVTCKKGIKIHSKR